MTSSLLSSLLSFSVQAQDIYYKKYDKASIALGPMSKSLRKDQGVPADAIRFECNNSGTFLFLILADNIPNKVGISKAAKGDSEPKIINTVDVEDVDVQFIVKLLEDHMLK